jgi:hypothetical protein
VRPITTLPTSGRASLVMELVLAPLTLFGGWALIAPPSGADPLGLSVGWLAGTPFATYLVPGLLLFGVFGVGSCVAALLGLQLNWFAPLAACAIGIGLVIWITTDVTMLYRVGFHPFQLTLFVLGAVLALKWWRKNQQRDPGRRTDGNR